VRVPLGLLPERDLSFATKSVRRRVRSIGG